MWPAQYPQVAIQVHWVNQCYELDFSCLINYMAIYLQREKPHMKHKILPSFFTCLIELGKDKPKPSHGLSSNVLNAQRQIFGRLWIRSILNFSREDKDTFPTLPICTANRLIACVYRIRCAKSSGNQSWVPSCCASGGGVLITVTPFFREGYTFQCQKEV